VIVAVGSVGLLLLTSTFELLNWPIMAGNVATSIFGAERLERLQAGGRRKKSRESPVPGPMTLFSRTSTVPPTRRGSVLGSSQMLSTMPGGDVFELGRNRLNEIVLRVVDVELIRVAARLGLFAGKVESGAPLTRK